MNSYLCTNTKISLVLSHWLQNHCFLSSSKWADMILKRFLVSVECLWAPKSHTCSSERQQSMLRGSFLPTACNQWCCDQEGAIYFFFFSCLFLYFSFFLCLIWNILLRCTSCFGTTKPTRALALASLSVSLNPYEHPTSQLTLQHHKVCHHLPLLCSSEEQPTSTALSASAKSLAKALLTTGGGTRARGFNLEINKPGKNYLKMSFLILTYFQTKKNQTNKLFLLQGHEYGQGCAEMNTFG